MRLIDADAIPYTMLYKENWLKGTGVEKQGAWKDDIDALPTVDAVEVVRCKDCIFNRAKDWVDCFNNGMFGRTTDNFCSRGEKRKNDT